MSSNIRRNYTPEFKIEVIKMVTEGGYSSTEVCERLGISKASLFKWKQAYSNNKDPKISFPGKGHLPPDAAAYRALLEECARLKREKEILKKAMIFFTDPSR